jgi:hypothetical protein
VRAEDCIAAAQKKGGFGILTGDAPWIHREGVLWHELSQSDLLFVTLNRSEALFSPSTRCRDLTLSTSMFHWESHEGERPMARGNLCGGWRSPSRRGGCRGWGWRFNGGSGNGLIPSD